MASSSAMVVLQNMADMAHEVLFAGHSDIDLIMLRKLDAVNQSFGGDQLLVGNQSSSLCMTFVFLQFIFESFYRRPLFIIDKSLQVFKFSSSIGTSLFKLALTFYKSVLWQPLICKSNLRDLKSASAVFPILNQSVLYFYQIGG